MYVPDNLDAYNAYSESQEKKLEQLPECSECGEKIQDEFCFLINDELICCDCMKVNHRVSTEDYI